MFSQKSRRRIPLRAEASTTPRRLSRIAEAGTPHGRAVSCNARFCERDAAVQTSGLERRLGGRETFLLCKLLKTNETELEFRQIFPRSEETDATAATVSPNQEEPHPESVLGSCGKSAGRRMRGGEIFLSANRKRGRFPGRGRQAVWSFDLELA
jgi:hypothetical protein